MLAALSYIKPRMAAIGEGDKSQALDSGYQGLEPAGKSVA